MKSSNDAFPPDLDSVPGDEGVGQEDGGTGGPQVLASVCLEEEGGQAEVGEDHEGDEGEAEVVEVGGQQRQHAAPTHDVDQVEEQAGDQATVWGALWIIALSLMLNSVRSLVSPLTHLPLVSK